MNDRARLLRVIAIIASCTLILCLMFIVTITICAKGSFSIYPYISLLISIIPCIYLWKIYIDEKKHNSK